MKHDPTDTARKAFFNERAGQWLDMWYKNPETGEYTRFDDKFKRLFGFAGLQPGDHVLDLGCGSGVLVPYILERIGEQGRLVEVDYAEQMIAVNRQLHNDPRVRFLVADVSDIRMSPASFDAVICFACFPHFSEKQETLNRIAGMLKPGRGLLISHFDSAEDINMHHGKHESVMHDHLPDEQAMRAMVSGAGLETEIFMDQKGFYLLKAVKPGN